MMGPNHALSTAAAWLYAYPLVETVLHRQFSTPVVLVGAAVTAGAGLLPDLDEKNSTVSRSFGLVTEGMSSLVNGISAGIHNVTAGPRDDYVNDGHRTFTHTAVAAGVFGALSYGICTVWGKNGVLALLFFFLGLAVRGLMADVAKREGWIGVTLLAAGGTLLAHATLPASGQYGFLAAAIVFGCILHVLGDMITKERAPLLAPMRIRGKNWYTLGLPSWLTIRAGGWVERAALAPAFALLAAFGLLRVVDPQTASQLLDGLLNVLR